MFIFALAVMLVYQLLDLALDIAVGTSGDFAGPQQEPFPSADRPVTVNPQPPTQVTPTTSGATTIEQVEISRTGQQTIVRVEGNGHLTCQPERLNNPERLVLDFSGARLGVGRTPIPSALQPVRRIRLGQFKPNVTRAVIDLEHVGPYSVQSEGNSFTVAFAASNAVPASMPGASPMPARKEKSAAQARRGEAAQQPAPRPARNIPVMLRPESSALRPAALASPVLPEAKVYPFENTFENGMLTFSAHEQTLRSILGQIGAKANVEIVLSEGLGDEKVSVEFRHYRLEEALRQVLKNYDAFFFYGADENKESSAVLKSVWVYAASRGRGFKPTPRDTWPADTQEFEKVREALRDVDDRVRTKALHLALSSGVEFPQEFLIDLVLNDQSMNVRFLALKALPLDPRLSWVAERALHDSSPYVSKLAQEILEVLNRANASWGPSAAHHRLPNQ
ncbi:MAG TPA: AMIN domain-containing protein [Candidatus Acidoferrales bacterium]|nr:AMIN domain-containing protein [Candidatus Acidoferrales bacterium]